MLAIFSLWDGFRVGFSYYVFDDSEVEHWYGHTMDPIGSTAKTLGLAGAFICSQAGLFRIISMRFDSTNDLMFSSVLRSMVSRRESKFLVLLLKVVKLGITIIVSFGLLLFSACMVINVMTSESRTESIVWILWLIPDIFSALTMPVDAVMFPVIWILVVRNLKRESSEFTCSIFKETDFRHLVKTYASLAAKSDRVNGMSREILFVIAFCNTPMICTIAYCFSHLENFYFKLMIFISGMSIASIAALMLMYAASMTTTPQELSQKLYSLQARSSLNTHQRKVLLSVIEAVGRENPSIAIYTMSGERYTSLSMMHHFLETAITYTLLVTFEREFTKN